MSAEPPEPPGPDPDPGAGSGAGASDEDAPRAGDGSRPAQWAEHGWRRLREAAERLELGEAVRRRAGTGRERRPHGAGGHGSEHWPNGDPDEVLDRADRVFGTIEAVRPGGSVDVSAAEYDLWTEILTARGLPEVIMDEDED